VEQADSGLGEHLPNQSGISGVVLDEK